MLKIILDPLSFDIEHTHPDAHVHVITSRKAQVPSTNLLQVTKSMF